MNKRKMKKSRHPSDRKTQEFLERHYTNSISILEPLKARVNTTDELVDEIVYRLYGLTEEEIKVVKGTIS